MMSGWTDLQRGLFWILTGVLIFVGMFLTFPSVRSFYGGWFYRLLVYGADLGKAAAGADDDDEDDGDFLFTEEHLAKLWQKWHEMRPELSHPPEAVAAARALLESVTAACRSGDADVARRSVRALVALTGDWDPVDRGEDEDEDPPAP
jgi:hypothetical protein